MLGNRAVGHFLQAKLTISQPHDPYEREADQVADTVMRMPEPEAPEDEATPMQPTPLVPRITPLMQSESEVDEEEAMEAQPTLQRETEEGTKEEEENVVATQPLIQRIPESELEEGAEEEAGGGNMSIQRMQAQEPEEDEEKGVITKPFMQRQAKEEEEAVQTKGLPGQFPRPGVTPFPPSTSAPGSHLQRVCSACDAELRRQPAERTDWYRQSLSRVNMWARKPPGGNPRGAYASSPVSPTVAANIQALEGGGSPCPRRRGRFLSHVLASISARCACTRIRVPQKQHTEYMPEPSQSGGILRLGQGNMRRTRMQGARSWRMS